jgi:hypothetical protein
MVEIQGAIHESRQLGIQGLWQLGIQAARHPGS